jgi:hypothetical protein
MDQTRRSVPAMVLWAAMHTRRLTDIYEQYDIMPGLALHQLRVAAVGAMICDRFDGPIEKESVVRACLFHDMGNIIKSDLKTFPGFLGEKGYDYWSTKKDAFIARYGTNEHDATLRIAGELGMPERVIALIDGVAFSKLEKTRDTPSLEQKIVEYADLRVAPHGILPMHERIEEAGKRYIGRQTDMPVDTARLSALVAAAEEVERQIFSRCSIAPEDINDASAAPVIEKLREYTLA